MSLNNKNTSVIRFIIRSFPTFESLYWIFDSNKSFAELKNDLEKKLKIKKDTYYFEISNNIIKENMILKDAGISNDSYVNIINNDCIKVKIEVKNSEEIIQIIEKNAFRSDFKVIKADENRIVKVCKLFFCDLFYLNLTAFINFKRLKK